MTLANEKQILRHLLKNFPDDVCHLPMRCVESKQNENLYICAVKKFKNRTLNHPTFTQNKLFQRPLPVPRNHA